VYIRRQTTSSFVDKLAIQLTHYTNTSRLKESSRTPHIAFVNACRETLITCVSCFIVICNSIWEMTVTPMSKTMILGSAAHVFILRTLREKGNTCILGKCVVFGNMHPPLYYTFPCVLHSYYIPAIKRVCCYMSINGKSSTLYVMAIRQTIQSPRQYNAPDNPAAYIYI
jgi:hypothetical protein